MRDLKAEPVYVPPLKAEFLERGHAVHFRCHHPEAEKLRVDIMARMRGVAPFTELWERRTTITEADGTVYELLALPDLVRAKKTQRDKDWPMIRRLLEADFAAARGEGDEARATFWLRELRTPELLIGVARQHPGLCKRLATERALLRFATASNAAELPASLEEEEKRERECDRIHWQPLKAELESLRRGGSAS